MSKAFTKDDAPEAPLAVRGPVPLEPGMTRYLTGEGEARLRRELSELESQLPAARREGDLSTRAVLEERAQVLLAVLAEAVVVRDRPSTADKTFFGAWVEVEDPDGERRHYQVVGPDEADPREGRVSIHSPLGGALMGKAVGDVVEVPAPNGTRELEVLAIR